MNTDKIKALHDAYVMPTYAPSLALVKGRGSYVWDAEGVKYLDFVSGIAVTNLGHAHPDLVKAISRQAGKLMHVSNLYFNEVQPRLARKISSLTLGGKVFFCNSGAEANEGLIKLARKWGSEQGRYEIVTFRNSFHGRTLATLTATGQDKVKTGFHPLPEGFVYAELNNLSSVEEAISEKTAAVMVEAVQGEGGVVPASPAFMQGLRALCDAKGILLFVDEIQTGFGRTGEWFGYQHMGIEPDGISMAKGMGGGFPIGAFTVKPDLSEVLTPGSHGTTFGGTPLACAAARAVIKVMEKGNLVEHAREMGLFFSRKLTDLVGAYDFIEEERGHGLIRGLVLKGEAAPLQKLAAERGLLVIATAGSVIRMLPPLNVTKKEIKKAVGILEDACKAM